VVLLGPTGPEDVDGRVGVGVGTMPARLALEHGAAPVPSRDVRAVGTGSAGVAGVHGDDTPTGAFSLVGDHRQECSPPGVTDATVQPGFRRGLVGLVAAFPVGAGSGATYQVRDRQVFVDDEVVVVDESSGELMGPVLAAVADVAVGGADALPGAPSTLRAALFGLDCPLGCGEASHDTPSPHAPTLRGETSRKVVNVPH